MDEGTGSGSLLSYMYERSLMEQTDRDMKRHRRNKIAYTTFNVVVLSIVSVGVLLVSFGNERHITCTVDHKDPIPVKAKLFDSPGTSSQVLVYTKDCGTMEVRDVWLRTQVSADIVHQQIRPSASYKLHVVGYRNGLIGLYPTILDVQEVTE